MKSPIYLDNHATTPVDPRVYEAIKPCLTGSFGNASSASHAFGWQAKSLVDRARAQAASLIGGRPDDIVFTAGATEANNLALKGVFEIYRQKGTHIITQATEHKSVLEVCRYLEKLGARVTCLPVDSEGRVRPEDVESALTDKTILISIMAANNEIGTLQPIESIGRLAKEKNIFFHVDGAQWVGKLPMDVDAMGIDLLSFSGHKMYGPKGVGVLFVRRAHPHVRLAPQIHGGGQEEGLRSGTLNVPGIVGLGAACEIAQDEMGAERARVEKLRDRLQKGIQDRLKDVYLNGPAAGRLYNNLNLSFLHVDGQSLLMTLNEDLAVSTGSACISQKTEASYVLKAAGLNADRIATSVRFGLGRFNTAEEIDAAVDKVVGTVQKLRAVSPFLDAANS